MFIKVYMAEALTYDFSERGFPCPLQKLPVGGVEVFRHQFLTKSRSLCGYRKKDNVRN